MNTSPFRRGWIRCGAAALLTWTLAGAALAAPEGIVEIRDYRFTPERLTVPAGSTVRWVNREKRTAHSVRLLGPGGFESERFFPDESWSHRFERPGRYPYECGPHPEMKGEVVVE